MSTATDVKAKPTSTVERWRWFALAVVLIGAFLDMVDVTIVNIAIPSIQKDLGTQFSALQWITGGYALAFGVILITGGRLGDIYGRKRLFLLGIAGFTLTSALCGLASTPGMLITGRVLQGAAAALMVPQVLSIINATFPAEERGKVFGMYGAMIGLGSVSGPMIGALLIEWDLFGLDWRPVFLINVPFGLLGLFFGYKFISESKAPQSLRLDVVGVVLVTVALFMVLYPLTRGRELDWPLWGFVMMAGGLVVLAGFVRYEQLKKRRDGSPLAELSLFKIRSFAAGVSAMAVFGLTCGIFFLTWTIYMQLGLGWSPLRAGLTGVPFSVAVAVASGLSVQKLVPKFGNWVLRAGAALLVVGTLSYLWAVNSYGTDISTAEMLAPLVVMGIGFGLLVAPIMDAVLSEVPAKHSGTASGLINTAQQLGIAFGLGLVSLAFFTVVDASDPNQESPAQIYSHAFANSLWWVAACMIGMFVLLFALPKSARTQPAAGPTKADTTKAAPKKPAAKTPAQEKDIKRQSQTVS